MKMTARHVGEMTDEDGDGDLAVLECRTIGASFRPEKCANFLLCPLYIPRCQFHYKRVIIFGVEPTILTLGVVIYSNIQCHVRRSDRARPYGPTDRLVPLMVNSIAWPNDNIGPAYRCLQQSLPNARAPHAQHQVTIRS